MVLALDTSPGPEAATPKPRKPKVKTLSRARSVIDDEDEEEHSAPLSASQEARRVRVGIAHCPLMLAQTLKLTSPSKTWIDDDQPEDVADEAEGKETSSPPTSFLPPPSVAAPRAQRTSSASSLPSATSPVSAKPQVGAWISKGSSPHSSPSPAKKARPSRSRASGAARDRSDGEELVAPASAAAADNGTKDAPSKRHRFTDPPTSKTRTARASSAEGASAPRRDAAKGRSSSRAKRKASADSGSEEARASDDESGDEGDGLLNDVAEVAPPEDKKAIKRILRRDKGLRELYL